MLEIIKRTLFRTECRTWCHDSIQKEIKIQYGRGRYCKTLNTVSRRNLLGIKVLRRRTPSEVLLYDIILKWKEGSTECLNLNTLEDLKEEFENIPT